MIDRPCPCGSGKTYKSCCASIIEGLKQPDTAVELMKARYSAHVKGKYEFILQTTHPTTRGRHDIRRLKQWADSVAWKRLDVLSSSKGKSSDEEGIVEFQAWYYDDEGLQCLRERSNFARVAGHWFYVDGDYFGSPKLEGHKPCPCGSGVKYSACCGS